MDRIREINPERIEWCCEDYGITIGELASEVGIAESTMERVVGDDYGLTFSQLQRVATFFGRGIMFFLEDTPVDAQKVHTAEFRTIVNQKPELSARLKKLVERVEKHKEIYLNLLEDLDERYAEVFQPPKLPEGNVKKSAQIVRNWLGIGERNDFASYRKSVEQRGVLVFRSNGYAGKWQIAKEYPILGFALFDEICPVILIKKQTSESMQSFTLMHELGHLLLHRTSSIDEERDLQSHKKMEQEANSFAGNILVPDEFLALINDDSRPDEIVDYELWLRKQTTAWGVSCEVILRRLLDVGRIRQEQYSHYRDWRDEKYAKKIENETVELKKIPRIRFREPKNIFGDAFVKVVIDSLYAQKITLSKASGYLDSIKIKDLRQLEKIYARV